MTTFAIWFFLGWAVALTIVVIAWALLIAKNKKFDEEAKKEGRVK